MGTVRDGIVKRGRTWSYVIRVYDPETGLTKPRWVGGFTTEDAAKAARDEARVASRRGEYVSRSGITVEKYFAEWLEAHKLQVKPKTHEDYQRIAKNYITPHIGRLRLQTVRPTTLSNLYAKLLSGGGRGGRPLSPRTVGYVHSVIRKALNDAVLVDQLIPSNPALRAKRPRGTYSTVRPVATVWTAAQLATFLEAARGERLYPFFRLAAYSGMRRGELLFLRWSHLDLDADTPLVHVQGSTTIVGGQRVEGTPKSGRARKVSLDKETVAVLRDWAQVQRAEREFAGASWRGDDHVFLTELGSELPPYQPGEVLHRVAASANERNDSAALPSIRFHDLRHTHATLLLQAGVPVHVVAQRLGHQDPAITLRVYAHVLREQSFGVADTFAKALAGAAVSKSVSKTRDQNGGRS